MNKGAADFRQPLFKPHSFGKAGNDTRDVMCQHGPNRLFDLDGTAIIDIFFKNDAPLNMVCSNFHPPVL